MFRIVSGPAPGLADTADFLGRLAGRDSGLFRPEREVVVTRAPGRLDLMGGIADYSGSLVLELPIAAATHAALQLRDEPAVEIVSLPAGPGGEPRHFETSLEELFDGLSEGYAAARARFAAAPGDHWASYVAGAFLVLARERGARFESGARVLVASSVPEGKGVSSSAALEVAAMRAIMAGFEIEATPRETAFLCQLVENLVAGAPCGVMDQMTSACGEEGRLLALLCQPGELRGTVALPDELGVWGVDSGIRHSVGGGDYGTVRAAAFMGYRMIADAAGLEASPAGEGRVAVDDSRWGGYLANVGVEEFEGRYAGLVPERMSGAEFLGRFGGITDAVTSVRPDVDYPVLQATRHPIHEHERVTAFAAALDGWQAGGRPEALGELMYASHESYSACGLGSHGTDELVRLVRGAGPGSGLYGAKITGGGCGGTVAVLGRADAGPALTRVACEYARRTGLEPLVISGSSPGAGAFGHLVLTRETE